MSDLGPYEWLWAMPPGDAGDLAAAMADLVRWKGRQLDRRGNPDHTLTAVAIAYFVEYEIARRRLGDEGVLDLVVKAHDLAMARVRAYYGKD